MSITGKQSPLGVNTLAGILQNKGLFINATKASYTGSSTSVSNYTNGSLVSATVLNTLTDALRQGYAKYLAGDISLTTYENLFSIGTVTIPALGNTRPITYDNTGDPGWGGAGYTGEVASYGYIRLFAWQAYNEFNYNDTLNITGYYTDFLGSFLTARAFIEYSNKAIMTLENSLTFLQGTYSNMNDLISADVTGVNLATQLFGQDLINTGKALNLSKMSTFGLPSNLIETCKKNNALTNSLVLSLLASDMTQLEVESLILNKTVSKRTQQKAYAAMLLIKGVDLANILLPLNCKTPNLESLADLLNPKKLFPNSFSSLTVPVYNTEPSPTNSKTYYPIYIGTEVNPVLIAPPIVKQIGPQNTPGAGGWEAGGFDGAGIGSDGGFGDGGGFGGDSGGSDGGGGGDGGGGDGGGGE